MTSFQKSHPRPGFQEWIVSGLSAIEDQTLVNGFEPCGDREVSWSGKDDQGQPVVSGVYFYQLTAPSFSMTKKMVLLK
jgi:hypothetical protein